MHNISIRNKIAILAAICLILALGTMVSFFLYDSSQSQVLIRQQTSDNLRQSARDYVGALASDQASQVRSVIERHLFRVEVIAESVLSMRADALEQNGDMANLRRHLKEYVHHLVEAHGDIKGIFLVMRPDALDDQDYLFHDNFTLASNEQGRFAPYWYRDASGKPVLQVVSEHDVSNSNPTKQGMPQNQWFSCPLERGRACVLNPYVDEVGSDQELITSVTVPLISQGRIIGVVGIDLSVAAMQPLIEQVDSQLVSGEGQVALVSQDGFVVANDTDVTLLGESKSTLPAAIQAALEQQPGSCEWSDDLATLYAVESIVFSGTGNSWTLAFSAPAEQVLASAIALDKAIADHNDTATWQALLVAVVITLASLGVIWISSLYLVRPIWNMTHRLQTIASGEWDLTQRLTIEHRDEVGTLVHWFNQFLEKLQTTVQLIDESVNQGQATSQRASEIAARTSDSSQQQLLEMEQVATALEQMTATANSVSENAAQAADAAGDAGEAASEGQQVAGDTSVAVQSLVQDVSEAMPMARQLEQESQNIESILKVIQEIAEQTNLLALNAAIEAARAGEQGRGFAVVASEVRALAERTQQSVGEIRRLIELLQGGTRNVVQAISSGNDKALAAVSQVQAMDDALKVIVEHIRHITDNGAMIANLASEQSSVSNEISLNVSNIREASRSIATEAEASAGLSEELQQLSVEQREIVTQFKV
ncbi:methyl-accepting chemotaxis protein [Ferrimonas sp. YFM]|uniref:methyl-accepting chemotaxis protein n=1 Tax=Ferrimonas sp. YFM TaxID=3028878 RepID=UPI0025747201|nr:methyl-accepting chemotaxis protein [Ferrimonas sp. YFM]BDY05526.1 methyl-accepting chemotaxis protein [Ferrimonas sp. YFM]